MQGPNTEANSGRSQIIHKGWDAAVAAPMNLPQPQCCPHMGMTSGFP